MPAFINVPRGMPVDCSAVRKGRVARIQFSRHFLFIYFYRTAVICRAQRCNPGISHSLSSESQTFGADRAISAWALDFIERSNAAIFRQ